ncbi:hypothetical protein ACSJH2_11015, partial [Klebsiella pneumoniae]
MQPYFHWINEPAEWRRDSDGLTVVTNKGTVAKLAMRQPFVLFKGLTF